jgi:hypothetical protein
VKASGLGRSGAPDEVLQDFVGDPTAVLVYPSDRNEPVRMVETTFRHFQSTFSPLSVHVGVHVHVHVRGSTWTPWRSTSKGVTKGMVKRAGSWVGR